MAPEHANKKQNIFTNAWIQITAHTNINTTAEDNVERW